MSLFGIGETAHAVRYKGLASDARVDAVNDLPSRHAVKHTQTEPVLQSTY
jgi:hypothetical protein